MKIQHWLVISILVMLALSLVINGGETHFLQSSSQASPNRLIVVSTTEDELNSDGDCSLREAIQAANTDSMVDGCPAGVGSDTVELSAGQYNLTLLGAGEEDNASGDLDLLSVLLILGQSVTDTIISGDGDRVLHIHGDASVEIQQVMITNGKATDASETNSGEGGGGILNSGTLTLTNVTVSNNRAGNGHVCFPACSGYSERRNGHNGGGIVNNGHLLIQRSLIYANQAGEGGSAGRPIPGGDGGNGGGILNTGVLFVLNSSVSGNQSGDFGTGYCSGLGGSGGGIFSSGVLTLSNSTISANMPGHAVGPTSHCPPFPSGKGGGIASVGKAYSKNTIISGNAYEECNGVLTSYGFNLIQNGDHCTIIGITTGNLIGQSAGLAPLADYGGSTWSHALYSYSPAIDTGSCTDISFVPISSDQRSEPRPQINNCDIGAYEAPLVSPFYDLFFPVIQK